MTKSIDITPGPTGPNPEYWTRAKWKMYVRPVQYQSWLQRVSINKILSDGSEIWELEDGWNNQHVSGFLITDLASAKKWMVRNKWVGELIEVVIKNECE